MFPEKIGGNDYEDWELLKLLSFCFYESVFLNFLINPYLCTESTKKIGGTLGYLNPSSHQQDEALYYVPVGIQQ